MGSELSTVLVQTPCYELADDRLEPPLGLLYIATWLNSRGLKASIVDLSSLPISKAVDNIPKADVYGFSTYTSTYYRTLRVMQKLRDTHPGACMVAGGPHASALSEAVLQDFDFVVVGEGEKAMQRLLEGLQNGEAMPRILNGPIIDDLDELPFPDYALVDVKTYSRVVAGRQSLSVLSSRGCPYRCVFCNSIVMGHSNGVRFRSAENVCREILDLQDRWGIRAFRFQDDTFTLAPRRLQRIRHVLGNRNITFRCFGRVDRCNRPMTDLLYESGCRHISFGVETGSPELLRRMQKGQTVSDIRSGIRNAKASGLIVRVFLLVGFPGETWETVQTTVNLMLECRPHEFSVYPLIPYPGTVLYENPRDFGITHIDKDFGKYFQVGRGRKAGFVFRTNDLDERQIADMRQYVIQSLEPVVTWAGDSRNYK